MGLFDIHTHTISYNESSGYPRSVTPQELLAAMDTWGIAEAAVLPLESPECETEYAITAQTWELCAQAPDRLLPFVAADPRQQRALDKIRHYHARGAKGFGEHKCGLAIDDPRSMAIYRLCGELDLPVLFHMDADLNHDDVGLPGLERALRGAPTTTVIAHGPAWWSSISAADDRSGGYPGGPVEPGGAAGRLLAEQPNLYADISAGSGFNALTRDPAFTENFLEQHWRKLLFGTDYFIAGDDPKQPEWLRTHPMPDEWRQAIGFRNARRLLNLGDA